MIRADIRNVAIIAHVDHGKTTLVDCLLRQSGVFRESQVMGERIMDSNDLERERGITILSKNTAVTYKGMTINIVDTPGHADFSGEVERVLAMADGALIVVDACEGPMAQTKFVLRKALEQGLALVVVVNKVDRPNARPKEVTDDVLSLLIDLGADDRQLDVPVIYASAKHQYASLDPSSPGTDMTPLFESMLTQIPAPEGNPEGPLQVMITTLDYDDYLGRIIIGRVVNGRLRTGAWASLARPGEDHRKVKVGQVFLYYGLTRRPVEEASVGDIVAVAGFEAVNIGDTITDMDEPSPLPALTVDEPTITMTFLVNDSPFAGTEGKFVTSRQLGERLKKAMDKDVALRVEETDSPDRFKVSGRGELHLSILIENMRREGYELAVSKPTVITKTVDGEVHEPLEDLTLDLPQEYLGPVMERVGVRRGAMQNMNPSGTGHVRLEFVIPARGLMGFRSDFLTETRGFGIMNHLFHGYGSWRGDIPGRPRGSLVAMEEGDSTTYSLHQLEDRGSFFITPGTPVYAGMVVGEYSRPQDLDVNVVKKKHVTNMRSSTAEETYRLQTPRLLTLEDALEQIELDELVEVTPHSIRLRKAQLDQHKRYRSAKAAVR